MRLNPAKCVFGVSSGKFLGFTISQCGIKANLEKVKAMLTSGQPQGDLLYFELISDEAKPSKMCIWSFVGQVSWVHDFPVRN